MKISGNLFYPEKKILNIYFFVLLHKTKSHLPRGHAFWAIRGHLFMQILILKNIQYTPLV